MSQLNLSDDEPTQVRQIESPSKIPQGTMGNCPDCGKFISRRAESCPHCGRFIQSIRLSEVIGRNWIWRIAGGIILGYFGILIINFVLFFVFGAFILGAIFGGNNKEKPTPTFSR